jgi:lysophospholipase L1-like esterase
MENQTPMNQQGMRKSKAVSVILLLGVFLFSHCDRDSKPFTIYTIGDSTMADKKPGNYPETGWCQVLGNYLDESITVENHARNGRSSKSFIEEGRWQVVLDSLKPGDYVFIQFGHNDQKDYDSTRYTTPFGTYAANLEAFVKQSWEKGAPPILFTSIVRRKFGEDGRLVDTHGDYPDAVRQVAQQMDVPLVDLQKLTEAWVNSLGDEASKEMYLWVPVSENYPEGRQDDTHLSEQGAHQIAKMALAECISQNLAFANRIKLDLKDEE